MPEYLIVKDKIIGLASNVTETFPGKLELEFIESRQVEALLKIIGASIFAKMTPRFELKICSGDAKDMETMKVIVSYKGSFILACLIDYPLPSLGNEPRYILVPVYYTEKVFMGINAAK